MRAWRSLRELPGACSLRPPVLYQRDNRTQAATARETFAALRALFHEPGAPPVLQSDTGTAFTAGEVGGILEARGVHHLLSPPRLPSYNGACEAGNLTLKIRERHKSARNDRPGDWNRDEVEEARHMANGASSPGAVHAPTAHDRRRIRLLLSPRERERF